MMRPRIIIAVIGLFGVLTALGPSARAETLGRPSLIVLSLDDKTFEATHRFNDDLELTLVKIDSGGESIDLRTQTDAATDHAGIRLDDQFRVTGASGLIYVLTVRNIYARTRTASIGVAPVLPDRPPEKPIPPISRPLIETARPTTPAAKRPDTPPAPTTPAGVRKALEQAERRGQPPRPGAPLPPLTASGTGTAWARRYAGGRQVSYYNTRSGRTGYGFDNRNGGVDVYVPSRGRWYWGFRNPDGSVDFIDPVTGRVVTNVR